MKRVVIVGGGIAGVTTALNLSKSFDVTVIDRRNFIELSWATVRAVVSSDFGRRINFTYDVVPKIGKFVQGNVTNVTENAVVLEDGSQYPFDYVVICVGARYSDPAFRSDTTTREDRLQELEAFRDRIKAAKRILIVGGGPTGVEVAAEILDAYAGKNLTLVHSGSQLLDGKATKLANYAHRWLEAHGATVLLESRIEKAADAAADDAKGKNGTDGGVTTVNIVPSGASSSAKRSLDVDFVLWCVGNRPSTSFLKGSILGDALDERTGSLRVLPTLQVHGHPNAFAVGDCCDAADAKLAFLAGSQAEAASKNITALAKSNGSVNVASLTQWKVGFGMNAMMVTLGSGDGLGHVGGCTCTGSMPTKMKSRDLFVDKYRSQFGVPTNYV